MVKNQIKEIKDKRFENVFTDPKFMEIPKKIKKVQLNDKRFEHMFKDKRFNDTTEINQYGKQNKSSFNNLKKYYERDDENDDENEEEIDNLKSNKTQKIQKQKKIKENNNLDQDEEEFDNEAELEDVEPELNGDESDTSEEFEEFLKTYNQEDLDEQINEEDKIPLGDETSRLSVVNLDWENIKAKDLFVLFSSFCKGSSKILKVEIYPSEFGIKEMEKEQEFGPDKEIFREKSKQSKQVYHTIDEVDEDEKALDYQGLDQAKLREYELKKLKYYYAVVYCDSKETANQIYTECDGMEVERTQSILDLRFVPDSLTEFPYKATDVCKQFPQEYEPKFFGNRALQHSKVKLTWDTNKKGRDDLIQKAFKEGQFKETEMQELFASSESEDEDLKALFDNIEAEDDAGVKLLNRKKSKGIQIKEGQEIKITFNTGLEGINENIITENVPSIRDKSLYDQYLERKRVVRKERKFEDQLKQQDKKDKRAYHYNKDYNNNNTSNNTAAANKHELKLLIDDSLKDKTFKPNLKDERFAPLHKDPKFAVDPTSKEYLNKKKK